MTTSTSTKCGLGIIIAFWALVSLGDYPAPFIDDMFYIGAAINLAQHGVFSNPYCDLLATIGCGDHFYANMPFHDYLVAGWFKLFGISTLSLRVLYTLLALAATLLIFRLMPKTSWAWLVALFIALAVFGLLGGSGLRADALGLFFFLVGFDAWRARTPLAFFARNFFLGLVFITFPNLALAAGILSLFGLVYQNVIMQKTWRELFPFALALAAAYALCFVIFLACIDAHVFDFLAGLVKNQRMSAMGVRERFHLFTAQGLAKWTVAPTAFILVAGGLGWRAWRDPRRREERLFLALALLLFASLALSSFSSASGAHIWAFACMMTLLLVLARGNSSVPLWLGYALLFAVVAFGHDHVAIQSVLADPPPGPRQLQALRDEVARLKPERLYLDAYAVRELYNYNLPTGAFAYEMSSITGWGTSPRMNRLSPGAVLVVSEGASPPTRRTPDAGKNARPLRILGFNIPGVSANPFELEIVDARP